MIKNYNEYHYSHKEKIIYIGQGLIISIVVGWLFYRSFIGILLTFLIIPLYYKRKRYQLVQKRKWQLNLEFRDGIQSMATALSAGYSVENALEEAYKDLSHMYQKDAYIIKEFSYIINQLTMNVSIEKAFNDLGERSDIEDIKSFAQVFSIGKRTGGNLVDVIKTSSNIISDKIRVKGEIMTAISAKKKEAQIMKIIPFAFLAYLSLASPNLLDPLYHNAFGVLIMSCLLVLYLVAYALIEKIININF